MSQVPRGTYLFNHNINRIFIFHLQLFISSATLNAYLLRCLIRRNAISIIKKSHGSQRLPLTLAISIHQLPKRRCALNFEEHLAVILDTLILQMDKRYTLLTTYAISCDLERASTDLDVDMFWVIAFLLLSWRLIYFCGVHLMSVNWVDVFSAKLGPDRSFESRRRVDGCEAIWRFVLKCA